MTCRVCRRPVPANEAAAYGGRHEDCAVTGGEYANYNGGVPRALSAGEHNDGLCWRQVAKDVEKAFDDWRGKR